jgi:hypothetical protein
LSRQMSVKKLSRCGALRQRLLLHQRKK